MEHQATLPILGSTELDYLLKKKTSLKHVTTSRSALDPILNPGVASGTITCISGDRGTGKTTIALQLVVSLLIAEKDASVCILDTTGTFDVVRMHQAILLRLTTGLTEASVHSDAEKLLERIKIVRVFDFFGLLEAISEIKDEALVVVQPGGGKHVKRAIIPDSEDDDDDSDAEPGQSPPLPKIACIVIDNLTTVMNPLFKTNHVQAHATLLSFMRTFASLTKEQNLISIVLNSVVQDRPSDMVASKLPESNEITNNNPWLRVPTDIPDPVNHPSIFGSNMFKPALGRSFGHCVDLHLLLSKLPKRPHDVRVLGSETSRTATKPEMVNIAEIILDRWSNRDGLWCGFVIVNGSGIKNADI